MKRPGILAPFVTALVLALAMVLPAGTSADRVQHPDYVGKGRGEPQMRIAFRIDRPATKGLVHFQARQVPFTCDDGTYPRLTSNVFRAKLDRTGRRFERLIYSGDEGPGSDQSIFWFGGKLFDDGRRAKGFIFSLFDPFDPPDGPNLAECTTFGKVRWDAKRIR